MRAQRCKGTRDLSPAEMQGFRLIEGVFRDCCLKWGYQEVRTPTLEYLHLFTATGTLTPSRLRNVYSFLDWDGWSGERVVLRPDGTIPIARFYIDTMAKKELAKLFYVTNVFSFEETGKEARERWQCGAELVGAGSTAADVELVLMALEVLKKLGVDGVELRLSHAGLIRAILQKLGLGTEEQNRIFDQILKNSLKIKPVRILEWWYCPICGEVTYSGLCGHLKERQPFSGSMIRSMIQDKVKPTKLIIRPEVFENLMENADKYGLGSPFCTEEYLSKRQPVFELPTL